MAGRAGRRGFINYYFFLTNLIIILSVYRLIINFKYIHRNIINKNNNNKINKIKRSR
jgi:hypothetical protein